VRFRARPDSSRAGQREHRCKKEVFQMLDFTDGSTWFFSGLGLTMFCIALVFVFAFVARKAESR
jgi:hypothetical protein